MSEPIVFISHNKIKEGKHAEFRKNYQASIPPVLAGKTGTLAQLAYENEEATEFTIVRLFPSADALDLQIQGADERSKKTYTLITLIIDIPGMDASTDKTFLNSRLERSAQIRKQLIESEI